MGLFTEHDDRDRFRDKLKWVTRNILRIKDFNFNSPNPYKEQIDEVVDYIVNSINSTLGDEAEVDVEDDLVRYAREAAGCNCDLCQCFGQGNCIDHDENCDHCNNGGDPGECDWLLDI